MIVELAYSVLFYGSFLLIGAIGALIIYARWNYGTLEKVKGLKKIVKPGFIGGSELNIHKYIVYDLDSEYVRKYGKIYGFYEGRVPMIFIADPEMIKLIFVKEFDHFQNKRTLVLGNEMFTEMMDFLPYEKWKLVRNSISPTLSSGKIKNMSGPITEAIDSWMKSVHTTVEEKKPFNPKNIYMAITIDIIARCVFGVKLNSLDDPNNELLKHVQKFSADNLEPSIVFGIIQTFPNIANIIPFVPPESADYFRNLISSVMKSRSQSPIKLNDFVDCLNEMKEKIGKDPEYMRLKVTEMTLLSQGLAFMLAGFETTSTAMALLTYVLATNPEVQSKLIEEVDAYLARNNGKIEHETIGELKYMSACVMETLRMYPALIRIERDCTKDWYHESSGLHIPKGMTVQVPVHYVHFDKDNFEEPHKFKPERFLAENKDKLNPYTFLGFGLGNHNCIGMRFAKEIINLAMANVLKHYEFKANEKTKLGIQKGGFIITGYDAFYVDAVPRK